MGCDLKLILWNYYDYKILKYNMSGCYWIEDKKQKNLNWLKSENDSEISKTCSFFLFYKIKTMD